MARILLVYLTRCKHRIIHSAMTRTDHWITVVTAAALAKVSRPTIYLWAAKRKIRTKTIAGRLIVFAPSLPHPTPRGRPR